MHGNSDGWNILFTATVTDDRIKYNVDLMALLAFAKFVKENKYVCKANSCVHTLL